MLVRRAQGTKHASKDMPFKQQFFDDMAPKVENGMLKDSVARQRFECGRRRPPPSYKIFFAPDHYECAHGLIIQGVDVRDLWALP